MRKKWKKENKNVHENTTQNYVNGDTMGLQPPKPSISHALGALGTNPSHKFYELFGVYAHLQRASMFLSLILSLLVDRKPIYKHLLDLAGDICPQNFNSPTVKIANRVQKVKGCKNKTDPRQVWRGSYIARRLCFFICFFFVCSRSVC